MHSIFKAKVSHHRRVNIHLKDWKWKETLFFFKTEFLLWCQKKSSKRLKLVSKNFISDSMPTDSGSEDDIYHVLFTWILYKSGKYRALVGRLFVQLSVEVKQNMYSCKESEQFYFIHVPYILLNATSIRRQSLATGRYVRSSHDLHL